MNQVQKEFISNIKEGNGIFVADRRLINKKLYIYLKVIIRDIGTFIVYSLRLNNIQQKGFGRNKRYTIEKKEFYIKINSLLNDNLRKLIVSKIRKDSDDMKLTLLKSVVYEVPEYDLFSNIDEKLETQNIEETKLASLDDEKIRIYTSIDTKFATYENIINLICNAKFKIHDYNEQRQLNLSLVEMEKSHEPVLMSLSFQGSTLSECLNKMYLRLSDISKEIKDMYIESKQKPNKKSVKNYYEFLF